MTPGFYWVQFVRGVWEVAERGKTGSWYATGCILVMREPVAVGERLEPPKI